MKNVLLLFTVLAVVLSSVSCSVSSGGGSVNIAIGNVGGQGFGSGFGGGGLIGPPPGLRRMVGQPPGCSLRPFGGGFQIVCDPRGRQIGYLGGQGFGGQGFGSGFNNLGGGRGQDLLGRRDPNSRYYSGPGPRNTYIRDSGTFNPNIGAINYTSGGTTVNAFR